jgi:hypothetical protein
MKRLIIALAILLGGSGTALAQSPDIDLRAVHTAFQQIQGQSGPQALQWFEQEVNKYYHGTGYVSVAATQAQNANGQPMTIITGYVDHDGTGGYNPDKDTTLFRFVQTAPVRNNTLSYEFLDTWGQVYYRGSYAFAAGNPFYSSYYGYGWYPGYAFNPYYTSYARLAYLRSWRYGWRAGPAYAGWYRGFVGWRAGYGVYAGGLRARYGLSRYGYGVGYRFGYRGAYVRGGLPYARYGVRAYGGHYGGARYGGGRVYGGRRR